AISSALSSGDVADFQKSISTAITKAFTDAASKALTSGPFGEIFSTLFSLPKRERRQFQQAKRAGDTDTELDILSKNFEDDIGRIKSLFSGDSGAKITKTITDLVAAVNKLQEAAALASGDFKAAADAELKMADAAYAAGQDFTQFLDKAADNLQKQKEKEFQF